MPVYEYVCNTCKRVFQKEVKIKELELLRQLGQKTTPNCKHCKSSNVSKLISMPNIVYKGKGFTKAVKRNGNTSTDID